MPYSPPYAKTEVEQTANIILGIQGPPGAGKTASSLTFPLPIIAAFDRPDLKGLLSLEHLKNVKPLVLPFYDPLFIKNDLKIATPSHGVPDRHYAFMQFLRGEALKLERDQTLIIDSWTTLQDGYDAINWAVPFMSPQTGKQDDRAHWGKKIDMSEETMGAVIALRCNVVILFHEIQERDSTGRLVDKIQPLMQGKFVAKIKIYPPNFFRQICRIKKDEKGNVIKDTKGELVREFLWQTRGDDTFDAKCSRSSTMPGLVEANYSVFERF